MKGKGNLRAVVLLLQVVAPSNTEHRIGNCDFESLHQAPYSINLEPSDFYTILGVIHSVEGYLHFSFMWVLRMTPEVSY